MSWRRTLRKVTSWKLTCLYPQNLHDLHNDLLLMCEKRKIHGVQKLVPNLYDTKKYVIHITALDQALKHGLVLDRVDRVIEFDQSAWLALYIDFSTQLRTKVKNDSEKDFFKLINNSVFGKTTGTSESTRTLIM